jgi:glutamyl-tRNA synthetase
MPGLKARAKTLVDLAAAGRLYAEERPVTLDPKAAALLTPAALALIQIWTDRVEDIEPFAPEQLEQAARDLATEHGVRLGDVAQPIRAALTGGAVSPPIFEVASILGKVEVLARLGDVQSALPDKSPD